MSDDSEKTFFQKIKNVKLKSVINTLCMMAFSASATGGIIYGVNNYINKRHPTNFKSEIAVNFSADPDLKNDEDIKLGYPEHRYSITCASNGTQECVLEIELDKKDIVKRFPYVQQEWFTPEKNNRPWHTLDVIYSLPSYNGNKDLRFTNNVTQNKHLVEIMEQNGWIGK